MIEKQSGACRGIPGYPAEGLGDPAEGLAGTPWVPLGVVPSRPQHTPWDSDIPPIAGSVDDDNWRPT